jgi:hypothetical protein
MGSPSLGLSSVDWPIGVEQQLGDGDYSWLGNPAKRPFATSRDRALGGMAAGEIFLEKSFFARNHSRRSAFGVMAQKIGVEA